MPALHKLRQERFAQQYVKLGGVAWKAYVAAGYSPRQYTAKVNASRMLTWPHIQTRIQEIQAAVAKKHEVTVDSLVEELDEAKALALSIEQPAAAVAAINAKAKITGNIIERRESGKPGEFSDANTTADVLAIIQAEYGDETALKLKRLITYASEVYGQPNTVEPELDTVYITNNAPETQQ